MGEGSTAVGGREASQELEDFGMEGKGKKEKPEKEKSKDKAKGEKEKESDEGKKNWNFAAFCPRSFRH